MTLQAKMILLADGFRQRFDKTDQLSIDDMIKLVTPPSFKTTVLLNDTNAYFNSHTYPITVPDHITADIEITLTAKVLCNRLVTWHAVLKDDSSKSREVTSKAMQGDYTSDSNALKLSFMIPKTDRTKYTHLSLACDPLDGCVIRGIKVVASAYMGGVIKAALSAFRQHFKSHFFEKRGVD